MCVPNRLIGALSASACLVMKTERIGLFSLLWPHRRKLSAALVAVIGITAADVLQPWPLKIVLDSVLAGRRLPPALTTILAFAFGNDRIAVLNFAVAAVVAITALDSVSSYAETYLMTSEIGRASC